MGYSIYIGNGEMRPVEDEESITKHSRIINGKTVYYDVVVKKVKQPDAPYFAGDYLSDKNNSRYPSYCGWSDFCRKSRLIDFFYNHKDGLMREHPGFQTLHIDHAAIIRNALNDWKSWHLDAVPGFGSDEDDTLARLIWLDWWVDWAVINCEHAGIYNF